MADKLMLPVNHVLNKVRLARARAMAFNPGMGWMRNARVHDANTASGKT